MTIHPGQKIGEYRIIRLLGEGGMGSVYEAEMPDGVRVAFKLFTAKRKDDRFLRSRFVAEGGILARLSHPNLVRVHDMGVLVGEEIPFLAMDLILDADGRSSTLGDAQQAGRVDDCHAERWYVQLCRALRYCHAAGVVHRDVKLNNVLIDNNGDAILSDFGVSRIIDPEIRNELQVTTTFIEGETTGTRPVMGTYWYLSPELRGGLPAQPADDWYALGVLFFRLLTGMWYEPGTNAFELLAPYDKKWRMRIERLLSAIPADRAPLADGDEGPAGVTVMAGRRRWWLLAIGMAVSLMAVGVGGLLKDRAADSRRIVGVDAAPNDSLTFVYDQDTRFDFRPCPAGTNNYRNISVTITRPYWLAKVPVTRRQWFSVCGETLQAWRGGENAPMTYISRDEMTNFCARLNARFAERLPAGYEIRLPTAAEWRLAYNVGITTTNRGNSVSKEDRRARCEVGCFACNAGGTSTHAGMSEYYLKQNLPIPLVKDIWPQFPPYQINVERKGDGWMRRWSRFAPAAVGTKRPNELGLFDMYGNCYERVNDLVPECTRSWSRTEWGVVHHELYQGMGLSVTNPVERSGTYSLMLGTYLTPDLPGDDVWWAPFDRMPHLGFRLCLGPKLELEK